MDSSAKENEIFELVFNSPAIYYSGRGEFTSATENVNVMLYMSTDPKTVYHKIKVGKRNEVHSFYYM